MTLKQVINKLDKGVNATYTIKTTSVTFTDNKRITEEEYKDYPEPYVRLTHDEAVLALNYLKEIQRRGLE